VVLSSFYCIAILDGVGYTTGILLDSLLQDLGGGRAELSLAGSLQVGVYCLSGPVVGRLVSSHGCRPVCMVGAVLASLGLLTASFAPSLSILLWCYSVITGLGFGLMYIPSVVVSAPYFTHRRSLAIGLCLCGSGFGTFCLAPVSQHILQLYGWRWVMRTLSGLALLGVLCGATMVPCNSAPATRGETPATGSRQARKGSNKVLSLALGPDLATSSSLPAYLLFTLSDFLAFVAIYIPYTHLPPLAKYHHISAGDSAFLISAGGICNTLGRLTGGWLSDHPSLHPLSLTVICLSLATVPALLLPFCWAYWTFLVSFGSFTLLTGMVIGCTNPVLLNMLPLKCLSGAFSFVSALRGVAAMVGPPLAGLMVDTFLSPPVALYLSAGVLFISVIGSAVTCIVSSVLRRREHYIQL